jgi:hypothetical protein
MKLPVIASLILFLTPCIASPQTAEAEALQVLDEFMARFNKRDFEGMAALFHYPHVRFAHGDVSIWRTPEEFLAARSPDIQKRFLRETGWHRSEWTRREVAHAGDRKVHIAVRFTRYRKDGSVIGSYDSFYIVTKRDGRWGIQGRSSYAPGVRTPGMSPEDHQSHLFFPRPSVLYIGERAHGGCGRADQAGVVSRGDVVVR